MEGWLHENWFHALDAIGIIGSLIFTAHALRSETKTRKVANLLTITSNHREIWKELFRNPSLARVNDPSADPNQPISPQEKEFVNMVILHIGSVYEALKDHLMNQQDELRRDISSFFSLPIPNAIWEKSKPFQNDAFVSFIEECIRGGRPF